ncbi:MAG: hypothetical protein MZV64_22860 [Ignavibacteriales bacterium]|nr:hypothetical protein [Ignavibacteriales bacterium]
MLRGGADGRSADLRSPPPPPATGICEDDPPRLEKASRKWEKNPFIRLTNGYPGL